MICSDIDGTLLNKNRELSQNTIQQVKRINNIPFVLISSRMPKAMTHLQQQFNNTPTPLIAYKITDSNTNDGVAKSLAELF